MSRAPITIGPCGRRRLGAMAALVSMALLGSCSTKLSKPGGIDEPRETAKVAKAAKADKGAKSAPSKGSLQEARELAALQPGEPYWPFHAAELYVRADSLARAETWLDIALRRNPGYAPALSLLSRIYFQSNRHQEGVRLLEMARSEPARFPDGFPAELLAALALHYDALGRRDVAGQVIAGVPRSRAGSVGVYLTMRGDSPDSASASAEAMVRDRPKSAANQNNAGIARLRAGDPEGASKLFLRAIELDPKLPGPYYNLAILERFYRLDDDAAERWYREYRERASDDPDRLAQLFEKPVKPMAEKKD